MFLIITRTINISTFNIPIYDRLTSKKGTLAFNILHVEIFVFFRRYSDSLCICIG